VGTDSKAHPTGFWFIFWGEFAERCSFYGMRAILAKYMSDALGYGEANAGTYMSFFIAACYFLPLLGGYIADNFIGKYWAIVGFSAPYILGQLLVGYPNEYVFVFALCLLAMGTGVTKPNISTLMGLTYDQKRPGNEQLRNAAFSYFYVAINIGALVGQLGVPYAKDEYGYRVAFVVPAVFMTAALIAFALGRKHYAVETPGRVDGPTATAAEKAAFCLRVSGLFLPVMMFWAAFDQTASTWVFLGSTYMHELGVLGFKVTAEQLQFINAFFIVTLTPVLRATFARLAAGGVAISPTQKMFVGFLLTAAASGILAFAGSQAGTAVEQPVLRDGKEVVQRVVAEGERVSMWWMVLAYFVLTVGELLISVTGLELAFVIAPQSMKGFVTALWLLMVWAGNLFVNAPVTRLYPKMDPATYFGLIAGGTVLAGLIFLGYALFVMKPAEPPAPAAPVS
jgi:POT family proton-dependent oligopeptide transporter